MNSKRDLPASASRILGLCHHPLCFSSFMARKFNHSLSAFILFSSIRLFGKLSQTVWTPNGPSFAELKEVQSTEHSSPRSHRLRTISVIYGTQNCQSTFCNCSNDITKIVTSGHSQLAGCGSQNSSLKAGDMFRGESSCLAYIRPWVQSPAPLTSQFLRNLPNKENVGKTKTTFLKAHKLTKDIGNSGLFSPKPEHFISIVF